MVIQCKNLISLYILPDQGRVNLRYFDFDQNRLWGGYEPIFIFLLFTFYPINDGWKSASTTYKTEISHFTIQKDQSIRVLRTDRKSVMMIRVKVNSKSELVENR